MACDDNGSMRLSKARIQHRRVLFQAATFKAAVLRGSSKHCRTDEQADAWIICIAALDLSSEIPCLLLDAQSGAPLWLCLLSF